MSRKGNVGMCALYPPDFPLGIIHSDVLRIRVDHSIADPHFLMCQLHFSQDVQNQIANVSNGAIMAGVNVTKLKTITVLLPDLDVQKKFISFVEQTDKSKFELNQAIQSVSGLIKSLMQQDFSN
jgi:type I restriction enzyme S subunit